MDQSARLFRSRWGGLELEVAPPTPDVVMHADEDLLVHALGNLLSNGAQAALANPARPPRVRFAAQAHHGGVRIAVADSGCGIAPELRDRVFQPFFTTRPEGTGVGLSFARQVALSHGGEVALAPERELGGATLHLTIV